jgi:AraC-like DNA-binding protein
VDVALRGGIDQLLRSLAHVRDMPDHLGRLYSRSLCLAILARLGNGRVAGDRGAGDGVAGEGAPPRRRQAPLPKWRVRRVTDHIAAHIGEPIRLADMARAAGLTRMYFAAQFRAATGMCPHDYLLDCRIRHAQALLADPAARLVDVALSVGFQTQSHFTTAFRRRTGETPHRWRRRAAAGEGGEAAHPPARAFPADTIDRRLA